MIIGYVLRNNLPGGFALVGITGVRAFRIVIVEPGIETGLQSRDVLMGFFIKGLFKELGQGDFGEAFYKAVGLRLINAGITVLDVV